MVGSNITGGDKKRLSSTSIPSTPYESVVAPGGNNGVFDLKLPATLYLPQFQTTDRILDAAIAFLPRPALKAIHNGSLDTISELRQVMLTTVTGFSAVNVSR